MTMQPLTLLVLSTLLFFTANPVACGQTQLTLNTPTTGTVTAGNSQSYQVRTAAGTNYKVSLQRTDTFFQSVVSTGPLPGAPLSKESNNPDTYSLTGTGGDVQLNVSGVAGMMGSYTITVSEVAPVLSLNTPMNGNVAAGESRGFDLATTSGAAYTVTVQPNDGTFQPVVKSGPAPGPATNTLPKQSGSTNKYNLSGTGGVVRIQVEGVAGMRGAFTITISSRLANLTENNPVNGRVTAGTTKDYDFQSIAGANYTVTIQRTDSTFNSALNVNGASQTRQSSNPDTYNMVGTGNKERLQVSGLGGMRGTYTITVARAIPTLAVNTSLNGSVSAGQKTAFNLPTNASTTYIINIQRTDSTFQSSLRVRGQSPLPRQNDNPDRYQVAGTGAPVILEVEGLAGMGGSFTIGATTQGVVPSSQTTLTINNYFEGETRVLVLDRNAGAWVDATPAPREFNPIQTLNSSTFTVPTGSTITIVNTNFPDANDMTNRITVYQPNEIYTLYSSDQVWQYPVHRGKRAGQLYYGAPYWEP